MSEKRDYYEVLGVSREVSDDDVRRAYRKLALQYHPDRNPDDPSAEAKFKEATEAYSVISDKEKRATYDRYGHQGLSGAGGFDFSNAGVGDIFSQFQDIFSDFFGGGSPFAGGRRSRKPQRGQDVRISQALTLAEAMTGAKKEVTFSGASPCDTCKGSGAKAGTQREGCRHCGGSGQVATQRGFIMFSSTCPVCRGAGSVVANPCEECQGGGNVRKKRSVLVTFPAGIDSGQRLRVAGKGMAGPEGTASGDLYVDVEVQEHPEFERNDLDLITKRSMSYPEAALGTTLRVTLPDGSEESLEVPAGTQPGTLLTVKHRGLPSLNSRHRGHLHVVTDVTVPKKVSRRVKKLLEELEAELQ